MVNPPSVAAPREALNRIVGRLELAILIAERTGDPLLVDLIREALSNAREASSLISVTHGRRHQSAEVIAMCSKALTWANEVLNVLKDLFSDF